MHGDTWPTVGTGQASVMATDWTIFLVVGACVGVIVVGLILFVLVRWRKRRSDAQPPQFKNNLPLEIGWTVVPLLVVGGLFFETYRAEARIDAVSDHPAAIVAVNAYRWGWTFAYRGGPTIGGASNGPSSLGIAQRMPELVLPLGETTRIALSASDVDHGFWIPDFLFKRDAIPGQTTVFDLSPTEPGIFKGRCSAFCGLQHESMLFRVRVVTPSAFVAWEKARS